jgi:hypothetical protein
MCQNTASGRITGEKTPLRETTVRHVQYNPDGPSNATIEDNQASLLTLKISADTELAILIEYGLLKIVEGQQSRLNGAFSQALRAAPVILIVWMKEQQTAHAGNVQDLDGQKRAFQDRCLDLIPKRQ